MAAVPSKQASASAVAGLLSSVYPLGLFKLLRALFTSPRNLALALASLWLHGKLTGKDNVRLAPNKKLVFYFPLAVYDVIARLAWTVNFAINAAPAYQPCGAPAWHDDKALAPGAVGDMAPAALGQLKQRLLAQADERFEEKEVVQLFDSLKEANTDLLIEKTWKGHVVRSGSVLDLAEWALVRPLTMLGFGWGKRYRSRHVGDPLLLNFMEKVYVPLPAWGNVSMLNMDYRGKTQATMRYCHQPWNDFFRVLDDGAESGSVTLLGVWCTREKNGGWFTLTHDATVETLPV